MLMIIDKCNDSLLSSSPQILLSALRGCHLSSLPLLETGNAYPLVWSLSSHYPGLSCYSKSLILSINGKRQEDMLPVILLLPAGGTYQCVSTDLENSKQCSWPSHTSRLSEVIVSYCFHTIHIIILTQQVS